MPLLHDIQIFQVSPVYIYIWIIWFHSDCNDKVWASESDLLLLKRIFWALCFLFPGVCVFVECNVITRVCCFSWLCLALSADSLIPHMTYRYRSTHTLLSVDTHFYTLLQLNMLFLLYETTIGVFILNERRSISTWNINELIFLLNSCSWFSLVN